MGYRLTISFPKGVNASPASLKCCSPKGIPIIVMEKRIPNRRCVRQIHIPPIKIQAILRSVEMQPDALRDDLTSLPNGHNARDANLIHWSPKGMPIMDIKNGMLARIYSMAMNIPPKRSQMRLPRVFIVRFYF